MKIVLNKNHSGFYLSAKALEALRKLGMDTDHLNLRRDNLPRHDERLVKVVEELGPSESGALDARLIVDDFSVPSGRYRIVEYDGYETVETPESAEWVRCESECKSSLYEYVRSELDAKIRSLANIVEIQFADELPQGTPKTPRHPNSTLKFAINHGGLHMDDSRFWLKLFEAGGITEVMKRLVHSDCGFRSLTADETIDLEQRIDLIDRALEGQPQED